MVGMNNRARISYLFQFADLHSHSHYNDIGVCFGSFIVGIPSLIRRCMRCPKFGKKGGNMRFSIKIGCLSKVMGFSKKWGECLIFFSLECKIVIGILWLLAKLELIEKVWFNCVSFFPWLLFLLIMKIRLFSKKWIFHDVNLSRKASF